MQLDQVRRGLEERLGKLTQRVDNILSKESKLLNSILARAGEGSEYVERKPEAAQLEKMIADFSPRMSALAQQKQYGQIVEMLAGFIDPVEAFFDEVLVIDKDDPVATLNRRDLLARLGALLTRYFDIRELAGQAERRTG